MPAVCRIGDKEMMECSGIPVRAAGSPNVYANGIPISRQGDVNTPHLGLPHITTPSGPQHPNCTFHSNGIAIGSRTVFVNGRGCGRVGDKISPPCNTSITEGSPNVFAGG